MMKRRRKRQMKNKIKIKSLINSEEEGERDTEDKNIRGHENDIT